MSHEWMPAPKKVLGRLRELRIYFGEMFDFGFYLVVGPLEDVGTYARWRLEDPEFPAPEPAKGWHLASGNYAPIVWLPRAPRTPAEIGTLVHECGHIVDTFARIHHIPRCPETCEVFCYALGCAVRIALEKLREVKRCQSSRTPNTKPLPKASPKGKRPTKPTRPRATSRTGATPRA